MSRILYLIASHTKPEQLIRLVKTIRFNSPDSYILIHHDYSSSALDRAELQQTENLHILEEYIPVTWGEFSLVEMELHCINWLLNQGIQFDWLILLSGQDYPIQPIPAIEKFLAATEYDGFMEYFLATEPPIDSTECGLSWKATTGIKRFFYHHYRLPGLPILNSIFFKLGRLLNQMQPFILLSADRNGPRLGVRCATTPFSSTFQCYAGSQWHTLSYRCVQYIHDFVQQNPAFVAHYRRTVIPDESFFQTILLNHSALRILNNNKRYIVWDNSKPVVLGVENFDRLLTSDRHFARKFDADQDSLILDLLDQYLLDDLLDEKCRETSHETISVLN